MSLITPDFGLLVWMTLIFGIVFFVLAKWGFPMITGSVEKRAQRIGESIKAAKEAEERLRNLAEEQSRMIEEARQEQSRILKEASASRDSIVEQAKADGYVTTLFGRRRDLPELRSSNFNLRSFGERVALNMPIQGTAADIIKAAMVRVDARMRAEGLEAKLLLQVHDELIVECPAAEAKTVRAILIEEMEHVVDYRVPLLVDAKIGASWAEAH